MNELIGRYFRQKVARRLQESQDAYTVARSLRKQGVPLAIALLLIVGKVKS